MHTVATTAAAQYETGGTVGVSLLDGCSSNVVHDKPQVVDETRKPLANRRGPALLLFPKSICAVQEKKSRMFVFYSIP